MVNPGMVIPGMVLSGWVPRCLTPTERGGGETGTSSHTCPSKTPPRISHIFHVPIRHGSISLTFYERAELSLPPPPLEVFRLRVVVGGSMFLDTTHTFSLYRNIERADSARMYTHYTLFHVLRYREVYENAGKYFPC